MAVIERLNPKAVLLENVPDIAAWDDGAIIVELCESLRSLGYRVDARVLRAFEYGVPQHRSRLFVVGLRDNLLFEWPEPIGCIPTLRDAIGDLPEVPGGQRADIIRYTGTPKSDLQRWARRDMSGAGSDVVYDHVTRAVRPDDAEAFALLHEGQTYEDLPERLQRYRSDIFTDKYKRLSWDSLSRTITAHIAKDGYWYIHPSQDRTLSVREAARLQTFPDSFRFAGHPSLRYRQIGNAVPPLLARALGTSLVDALDGPSRPADMADQARLRQNLLTWHAGSTRRHPWRREKESPWVVLLAELCLRRAHPAVEAAALSVFRGPLQSPGTVVSDETEARRTLALVGLSNRADEIIAIANRLVDHFGGAVPDAELDLESLPSLGDYTVQAIRCFAFDEPTVLLDRPTARVMTRVNGHDDDRRWQVRLDLFRIAGGEGPDRAFNSALLALSSEVCKPDRPHCFACPIRFSCATGHDESPDAQESFDLTTADV